MKHYYRKLVAICLLFSLVMGVMTSCAGSPKVKKIDGAKTEIVLDIYRVDRQEIKVSDYFNENGVENVTYSISSKNENVVKAVTSDSGNFAIEAISQGDAEVVLDAVVSDKVQASVKLSVKVENSSPEAPTIENEEYLYDRAIGGTFKLPIKMGDGKLSLVKVDGINIRSALYGYNSESGCLEIAEDYLFSLESKEYTVQVITTGGSVKFALNVSNTVGTSFDETTVKTGFVGRDDAVFFKVDFNGTTVKSIKYGDYELKEGDYSVEKNGISIKSEFFSRTYREDSRVYSLTLSNNERYEFSITTNVLFYSDYDLTTIHDELQSNIGHNSLYQDSTRVTIIDAPEGSGFSGKVLKFVPHTEDVALSVHGIYTFDHEGGTSTWRKMNFVVGKTYVVSFDYMTVDTKAGEDVRFRTYNGSLMGDKINTGNPGKLQHFSYSFTYKSSMQAFMLYGMFKGGGYLLVDNYSFVELDNSSSATSSPVCPTGGTPVTLDMTDEGKLVGMDCYCELPIKGEYFVRDGFLYTAGKTECKFMLSSRDDLSSFTISADFSPLDDICPLNAGFYFYADRVKDAADSIRGYNLQIEKGLDSSYFYLYLHRFDQGFSGSVASARVIIRELPIRLTLTADNGHIDAFVNGNAVLSYDVGAGVKTSGAVGLRTMRTCGAKIGNVTLSTDE